jgi:hypothetical protein
MPLAPLDSHHRLLLGNLGDDTEGLALAGNRLMVV